jgi:hypothetical protein
METFAFSDAPPTHPATARCSGRYEFRIFRPRLEPFATLLDAIAARSGHQASHDRYVLVDGVLDASLKLRNGALELKTLEGARGPLERWTLAGRVELPAQGSELRAMLAAGGLTAAPPERTFADAPELARWLAGRRGVRVVAVRKRRELYVLPGARAELTALAVRGSALRSLAVEGEDPNAVLGFVRRLGLPLAQNTSYPRLLRSLADG